MKKIIQMGFALVGAIVMTGCASSKPYFIDRGRDFRDTLTVGVEKNSLGVTAQAGPLLTGLNLPTSESHNCKGFGLRSGAWGEYRYHDIQVLVFGLKYVESVPLNPRKDRCDTYQVLMLNSGRDVFDNRRQPVTECYGPVEISASLGVGIRLGVNLFEIADFLMGWVGIDILDDDMEMKAFKKARTSRHTEEGGGVRHSPLTMDPIELQRGQTFTSNN